MEINDAKKLSLREMGLQVTKEHIGQVVAGFHIEANGWFAKQTAYGESICITGDITGINSLTGEVFNAPGVYLPGDAAQVLKGLLDKRKETSDTIIVDYQVSVAATNARSGYTYVVKAIETPEIVSRRKEAAVALLEKFKALPAPKGNVQSLDKKKA